MSITARPSFFKEPKPSAKVQRALRANQSKAHEKREKDKVRARERGCRVPFCSCKKVRARCEVSHKDHKGAGGNPTGDRSMAHLMVWICAERHRLNVISIDRGTLRWRPVDEAKGSNGRIVWEIDVATVGYRRGTRCYAPEPDWVVLLEEGQAPTARQWDILMWMADGLAQGM